MFGIEDPGIWLPYLLALICLSFSTYWGVSRWNKDDKSDSFVKTEKEFESDDE
jgi:hypothetical protein